MKRILLLSVIVLPVFALQTANGQDLSFTDFVGTWQETISSINYGYSYNTTLVVSPDGFYTETSGTFMPTVYPNTQWCDYDAVTNRFSLNWLEAVYAGMYFYRHNYYEVVYFATDSLKMDYNYWDDPIPHPDVETLMLTKVTPVTGIKEELQPNGREHRLVRIIDMLGREVAPDSKGQMLIYLYDDGIAEKRWVIAH